MPGCDFEGRMRFLNVDIDLASAGDHQVLREYLDVRALLLRQDEPWLSFELSSFLANADEVAVELAMLVATFPDPVRAAWDRCPKREFNLGLEIGEADFGKTNSLSAETVRRLNEIGMGVGFTIYKAVEDEVGHATESKKDRAGDAGAVEA